MIEYKRFTEDVVNVVSRLTDACFSPSSRELLHKVLANPLRRIDHDAGDLAMEGGEAVSFQAAILRKVAFGGRSMFAMTGCMLSSVPQTDPAIIYEVLKKSSVMRGNGVLYFGNTSCRAALRLSKLRGISGTGPDSCSNQRMQPINWFRFLWYMFLHVIFKKASLGGPKMTSLVRPFERRIGSGTVRYIPKLVKEEFDGFWEEYAHGCKGLVSSRTAEELEWAFAGDRWRILGYYEGRRLLGYIVLKSSDDAGNRWSIADWIAMRNDESILESLLIAAKKFLRARTRAMLFQTTGFPTFVQPILARQFKYSRPLPSNEFLYRFEDEGFKRMVMPAMDTKDSWFFGPYDGDACLF